MMRIYYCVVILWKFINHNLIFKFKQIFLMEYILLYLDYSNIRQSYREYEPRRFCNDRHQSLQI